MRGRRPKPTALREREGNPSGKKLNEHEPKPKLRIPKAPAHLTAEAQREWRRLSRELYELGLLTKVDRAALAAYCAAWARWVDAEQKLAVTGLLVKTPSGYPIQNPLIAIANKALQHMHKFAVEFGLTPASRSRIAAEPPGEDDEDDDKFLDGPAQRPRIVS